MATDNRAVFCYFYCYSGAYVDVAASAINVNRERKNQLQFFFSVCVL